MRSILVVTSNEDKFKEISLVLNKQKIKTKRIDLDFPEYGENIQEVAKNKAKEAFKRVKKPLLVEDTAIFFNAYKDFPGIYAKRIYKSLGLIGLIKLLENKSRKAYFQTVICYFDGKRTKTFSGKLHGTIVKEIHTDKFRREKFPYDRIFIENKYKKPVSLLHMEEKIKISHRAIAAKKFARWFSGN